MSAEFKINKSKAKAVITTKIFHFLVSPVFFSIFLTANPACELEFGTSILFSLFIKVLEIKLRIVTL